MKCNYCGCNLIEDFLGTCCFNEKCNSIDGTTRIEIWENGSKAWYKNGELHREREWLCYRIC